MVGLASHLYHRLALLSRGGASTRIGIHLKRALDTYFRHFQDQTAPAGVVEGSFLLPIYMASTTDEYMIGSMINDDRSRRNCIDFPEDTDPYRVHGVMAVPDTYWYANEQHFSIYGLSRFSCLSSSARRRESCHQKQIMGQPPKRARTSSWFVSSWCA
jgi:hypothetical protein